jgi:hypothetical protein
MKHHPQFHESRLSSVCLNFGEKRLLSRALFADDVRKCAALVESNGGELMTNLGKCELRFLHGEGHSEITLERNGVGLGLAGLATNELAAGIVCDELIDIYARMLLRLKKPISPTLTNTRADSLPWMGICLAPTFADTAPFLEVYHALTVFWAAAFAILAHAQRNGLTSKSDQPKCKHR